MNNSIEIIFKSSVVTVKFNHDYNLVYIVWNEGPMTIENYKEPYLFLLNEFKPLVNGIISNIHKQGIVGNDLRKWLLKDVMPKASAKGLKYFYVVSEANVFKQYYINTFFKIMNGDGVDKRLFTDYAKCEIAMADVLSKYLLIEEV